MSRPITISIPKPCHENWQEMTATERGAFCKSCQKEVIDFTKKTDDETYRILATSDDSLCGRYRIDQLNKPIYKTTYIKSTWHWKAIAASMVGLIGYNESQAKNIFPRFSQSVIDTSQKNTSVQNIEISGSVVYEDLRPVENATIQISNSSGKVIATFQSNSKGYFLYKADQDFNVVESFTLSAYKDSYLAYSKFSGSTTQNLNIVLYKAEIIVTGSRFTKNRGHKIRNFFRRIFHKRNN